MIYELLSEIFFIVKLTVEKFEKPISANFNLEYNFSQTRDRRGLFTISLQNGVANVYANVQLGECLN